MKKKRVLLFFAILILAVYGCAQQSLPNEEIVQPQQQIEQEQAQGRQPPPECFGKKATDVNLPEPCKIWFSIQNSQENPAEKRENEKSASVGEGKASEVSERIVDCQKSKTILEDLPVSNFPRPFELDYFTGLMSEEVIASFGDIEVIADKTPLVFRYPMDPFVARTILVKNKGSKEAVIYFKPKITIPNYDETMFINHPQPPVVYLGPSEIHPIRLIYSPQTGGPNAPSWKVGDKIDAPIDLELAVRQQGGTSETHKVLLENRIEVLSEPGPRSKDPESNAIISGIVVDPVNNEPIAGISVNIFMGRMGIDTKTNSLGMFSTPVYAFMRGGTNVWSEAIISVNSNKESSFRDYSTISRIVIPKVDETKKMKIFLPRKTMEAEYKVVKILDIGYQAYAWDASKDSTIFATVPFHTAEKPEVMEKGAYLHVFTQGGELLWKYPLGGETPTVDVSEDGTLIATTRAKANVNGGRHWGGDAILLDNKGNLVREFAAESTEFWWGFVNEPFSEVRLSPNNKYLAAGDSFGRLFLFDVSTGKPLWEDFTEGQVRKISFDNDIYVSSGDGYLRAYDIDGNLLWKTFVDAWLTDMDISENYIAATSKSGRAMLHLIEKKTGDTVWVYPVEQRGSGVEIAPDESYLFYGTDIGRGSTPILGAVFLIAGQPLFDMGNTGQAAAITADSEYIVSKNDQGLSLYSRDGELLWSKLFADDGLSGSMNHLLWISPDAKRIIISLNDKADGQYYGQIYFLQGGIKELC